MLIGTFVLTGSLLAGSTGSADFKIASVNIQRAVNECKEGKEAKKSLAKEIEDFQRLVAEKQRELQGMKDSLDKQGLMLNPEARAVKEKELETKARDFQRWGQDKENELNQKKEEMERRISSGLQKVIQKLGVDEGYTVVLEKNETFVLFSSPSLDITDRVIKLYDSQTK